MLSSQSVIDAERPGLGVGEGAVDPGQNDMGGHGADDMGLGGRGGAGVGRPAVGFDRRARGELAATKPCSEAAEKSWIAARRRRPGASFSTSTAPATNILPWGERPPPPQTGSVWSATGSRSRRPRQGQRAARGPARPRRGAAWRTAATRTCRNRAELLLQLQRRNPIRMGGHEIGGPEPCDQRQLRTMHDCAGRGRDLLAAGGAFEGEGLSAMRPPLTPCMPDIQTPRASGLRQARRRRCRRRKSALELDQRAGKSGMAGLSSELDVHVMFLPEASALVTTM